MRFLKSFVVTVLGLILSACSGNAGFMSKTFKSIGIAGFSSSAPPGLPGSVVPVPPPPTKPGVCDASKLTDGGARRLNAREFKNSLTAILGVAVTGELPPDGRSSNDFDTDGGNLHTLDYDADKYYGVVETAVDQAFAGQPAVLPCTLAVLGTAGAESTACAKAAIQKVIRLAFRRPVSVEQVEGYAALAGAGPNPTEGLKRALHAILLSPNFLYMRTNVNLGVGFYRLTAHEIAERMSMLLWSSVPDEELLAVADSGMILDQATARAQVARMLKSPNFSNFLRGFMGQYLSVEDLAAVQRDPAKYPGWGPALVGDMKIETETFMNDIIQNNRPLGEILTSDSSFINQNLASHYGMPEVTGANFRKVAMPASQRRGVLTQASVMTALGGAGRTSPTHRGFWMTRKITCMPPPPPPANIPALPESGNTGTTVTIRQRLEIHRKDAACTSCHTVMDPMGLAFESFDATGKWRTNYDNALPIDTRDTYLGRNFEGAVQLVAMMSEGQQFKSCFAENLAGFAIGRLVSSPERCFTKGVAATLKADNFTDLVTNIVVSDLFRAHVTR